MESQYGYIIATAFATAAATILIELYRQYSRKNIGQQLEKMRSDLARLNQQNSSLFQKQIEVIPMIQKVLRDIQNEIQPMIDAQDEEEELSLAFEKRYNIAEGICSVISQNMFFFPNEIQSELVKLGTIVIRIPSRVHHKNTLDRLFQKHGDAQIAQLLDKRYDQLCDDQDEIANIIDRLDIQFGKLLHPK
jgi:hypothetical protein